MTKTPPTKQPKKHMVDPTNWSKEKYYEKGKPTIKRKKGTARKK